MKTVEQMASCDRFEVGWGTLSDGRVVVALQPKREGLAIGQPLGLQLELARSLVAELERNIGLAEASHSSMKRLS